MASKRVEGITIEIGADLKGLNKALKEVNSLTGSLQRELKGVDKLLKLDPGNVELLTRKEKLLAESVEATSKKLEAMKKAQKEADEARKRNEKVDEKAYQKLQEEIDKTELQLKELEKQQKEFGSVSKQQLEQVAKKFDDVGKKVEGVGKKIAPLSAASAGLLGAAVKTAADFDQAMSQVEATMGKASAEMVEFNGQTMTSIEALRELAAQMGKETAFSASEAADAINILAMAGYNAEQQFEVLPSVLSLAAAGGIGIAEAADYATGIIAGFSNEALEAATVADKLAVISSSAKGDVSSFGQGLATVAGVANSTGQSLQDMTVALGLFGNANYSGAEAGNALARTLKNLYMPTEKAKKVLDQFGVSAYDVTTGSARPLRDVLVDLNKSLDGMTEEEKNDVLSQIFDSATMKSLPALLNNVGEEWEALDQAVRNSQGAAGEMADVQLNNLSGQLTILKSGLEALSISLGNVLMPYVRAFVEKIQQLVDWFNALSPTVKSIVVLVLAITAALSPVLIIVGKLISSIGIILRIVPALRAGILAINAAMAANPIGLVLAGIAALVAAIIYLYNNNEEFRQKVQAIFEKLKAAFNVVVDVVKKGIERVKGFVTAARDTVVNVYNKVVEIINSIKEKIAGIVTAVSDMRQKIIEKIQGFVNIGTDIVKGLWQGIKNAKDWILGQIKDWCGSILNGFKNFFGIHSPSVVMRDQVGVQLMAGLAIGMKNSAGEVMKTATDICNELITRMDNVLSGWSVRDTLQESQYKLWEMTEGKYLGEDEKLKKKLEFLRQELGEQGDTIDLMLQKWTQLKKQYGINSQEAMTYQNQVVQEKIKMQELQDTIEETEKALENFGKETDDVFDFGELDFSDAVYDFGDAANYAVSASYQQSDELLDKIATATAEYIGQALLSGLVGIQDTILAAMPSKLQLNLNGREVAETTWTDFDAVGDRKSRLFAPSRQTIANIAASVVNTYAGA